MFWAAIFAWPPHAMDAIEVDAGPCDAIIEMDADLCAILDAAVVETTAAAKRRALEVATGGPSDAGPDAAMSWIDCDDSDLLLGIPVPWPSPPLEVGDGSVVNCPAENIANRGLGKFGRKVCAAKKHKKGKKDKKHKKDKKDKKDKNDKQDKQQPAPSDAGGSGGNTAASGASVVAPAVWGASQRSTPPAGRD